MKKNHITAVLVAFGIIVSLVLILFLNPWNVHRIVGSSVPATRDNALSSSCQTREKKMTVKGYSMYPLISPEKEIVALFGYYKCHFVERGDIVLFKYSGNDNLLIKSVKAVPGDRWELKSGENGYEIVVNGSVLLNSEGKPYSITDYKMLQLYVADYPVIPENTYLLLGDKTDGSIDSTAFGLVSGDDIEAKVAF